MVQKSDSVCRLRPVARDFFARDLLEFAARLDQFRLSIAAWVQYKTKSGIPALG